MNRALRTLFAVLCFGASVASNVAQVPSPSPDAPSWRLGGVQFFPVGRLSSQLVDNLFSVPESAGVRVAALRKADAGFLAVLPFSQSRATLGYLYGWRDFGLHGLNNESNHQARLATEFVFSNGLTLGAKEDYENGVLDTESVDPAREVPFVAQRFQRHAPELSVFHERGAARRVGLTVRGIGTTFDDPRAAGFFDQDARAARLEAAHSVSPTAWVVWSVGASRNDLSRPEGAGFEAEERSERRSAARGGILWRSGPAFVIDLQGGWARYDYEGTVPSSFRSWVGEVALDRNDPAGSQFTARFAREAYASVYGDSNFLVSRQIRLTAANNRRALIGAGSAVSYYVSRYPDSTPARRDRSLVVEGWLGWRVERWVELRLEARSEHRSSTLSGAAFDRNEWGLSLRFGG